MFKKEPAEEDAQMPRSSGSNGNCGEDSNGSKEEQKNYKRKGLDADIRKSDLKMTAALQSYLSVSESDGEGNQIGSAPDKSTDANLPKKKKLQDKH